ncbi:MAG: tripartite tricarboxylate transporter substrate binding protein [Betaproteobacteria bacterium]|nr:tripartite tricarboxylate transporter substrate binding protein [Betaproteobacteria bacterium]
MKRIAAAFALAAASLGAGAQEFPSKSVTFVVPFAAGTATDTFARALGQAVSEATKQTVVVDNKPGASGMIAAQFVSKAAADGYTVLFTTHTTHAANSHLYQQLSYEPVKDFAPVALLGKGGQVLVVRNDIPAKSVGEFIALAKKSPGRINFASGSSSSRIAVELFQQMAGVELLHVPYKSNTLAVTDMLGGTIDMMITDTTTGLPQVQAGKLRALGYSDAKRSRLAPDVPTIAEAGVKGYEMTYWFAAYAPAGTPAPVVKRLNELLVAATRSATARAFFDKTGVDPATSTPEGLAAFQAAETRKWGEIVKKANIQPE